MNELDTVFLVEAGAEGEAKIEQYRNWYKVISYEF